MMASSNQRKLTFNCLIKDLEGSECCEFKVRQHINSEEANTNNTIIGRVEFIMKYIKKYVA